MSVEPKVVFEGVTKTFEKKGKELLQAARVGFERAMVTILDANITTFIAGLVLFNVGVGPIRGFAVTLSIGIFTSILWFGLRLLNVRKDHAALLLIPAVFFYAFGIKWDKGGIKCAFGKQPAKQVWEPQCCIKRISYRPCS